MFSAIALCLPDVAVAAHTTAFTAAAFTATSSAFATCSPRASTITPGTTSHPVACIQSGGVFRVERRDLGRHMHVPRRKRISGWG